MKPILFSCCFLWAFIFINYAKNITINENLNESNSDNYFFRFFFEVLPFFNNETLNIFVVENSSLIHDSPISFQNNISINGDGSNITFILSNNFSIIIKNNSQCFFSKMTFMSDNVLKSDYFIFLEENAILVFDSCVFQSIEIQNIQAFILGCNCKIEFSNTTIIGLLIKESFFIEIFDSILNFNNTLLQRSNFNTSSFIYAENSLFYANNLVLLNNIIYDQKQNQSLIFMNSNSTFHNSIFRNFSIFSGYFFSFGLYTHSFALNNVTFDSLIQKNASNNLILLYFLNNNVESLFENCFFVNNIVYGNLISIKNNNGRIQFLATNFYQNYANNAIYCENCFSIVFKHIIFKNQNNHAPLIKNENYSNSEYGSCILIINTYEKYFYNFSVYESSSIKEAFGVKIIDEENEIAKTFSNFLGLANNTLNITINISNFIGNSLYYSGEFQNIGGAFFLNTFYKFYLFESLVSKNLINCPTNTLVRIGGVCLNSISESNYITIENSVFHSNSAKFQSNCIVFTGFSLEIKNSAFMNHSPIIEAQTYEEFESIKEKFNLLNIFVFIEDSTGGAIYTSAILNTIISSYFEENQSTNGGSIFVDKSWEKKNSFSVNSSIFVGCKTGFNGGAIYFSFSLIELQGSITNSKFLNNLAQMGGGIFFDTFDLLSNYFFSENILYNNTAEYAGAIMLHQIAGVINIQNNSFLSNNAKEFLISPVCGGAVTVWGSLSNQMISKNNKFVNNFSTRFAGSLCVYQGNSSNFQDIFINSTSLIKGGTFTLFSFSESIIENCTIYNSFATNGGFIVIVDFAKTWVNNCLFDHGYADLTGGIIKSTEEASVVLKNSDIRNVYGENGGGIYLYDCLTVLSVFENCSFTNISSSISIISAINGAFEINNCSFTNLYSNFFDITNSIISLNKIFVENCSDIVDNFVSIGNCTFNTSEVYFKNISSFGKDNRFFYSKNSVLEFHSLILNKIIFDGAQTLISVKESYALIENSYIFEFVCGCFYFTESNLKINFTSFSNDNENFLDIITTRSIVELENENQGIIENCLFLNFISKNNGTAINILEKSNYNFSILIKNSLFAFLYTEMNGAGLFISHPQIYLQGNNFTYNLAQENGGGIYTGDANVYLNSSLFFMNKANKGGGALFWTKTKPYIEADSIHYQNNTAAYGDNEASKFKSISLEIYSIQSKEKTILIYDSDEPSYRLDNLLNNQKSGDFFQYLIRLKYLDWYNQTVLSLNDIMENIELINTEERNAMISGIEIKYTKNSYILGQNDFKIIKGELNIKGFKIISNPNSTIYIKMTPEAIIQDNLNSLAVLKEFELISKNEYHILIPLYVEPCYPGEIFNKFSLICAKCERDSFSFNTSDNSCQKCIPNAICEGGNKIIVNSGYWRSSSTSLNIYSCEENSENCLEGEISQCLNSFRGPLCRSCISGYYKIDNNSCIECQQDYWNYLRIIGFIILMLVMVLFLIKSSLDNNRIFLKIKKENSNILDIPPHNLIKKIDLQSYYLKIFVNYFQILTLLNDVPVSVTVPSFVSVFFDLCNYLTALSTKFIGFECIFKDEGLINIKPYIKAISVNLTPVILVFLSLFLWKIYQFRKKEKEIIDKIFMTIIAIYLMLQPNILNELTKVLVCVNIDGNLLLRSEPVYDCVNKVYSNMRNFFFWPAFIFWAYLIPLLILFCLFINRRKLNEIKVFIKFNFFYVGYRPKFYYWDILLFLRKSIVITLAIISENPLIKLIVALVIIGVYFNYQITKRPFVTRDLNLLEFYSNFFIISTIYLCVMLFGIQTDGVQFVILIFVFILNISFLVLWLVLFFKYLKNFYRKLTRKILDYIQTKSSPKKFTSTPTVVQIPPNCLIKKNNYMSNSD